MVDDNDLSLKKLDGYQSQVQELQKEKSDIFLQVFGLVSTINDLCSVLRMDFLIK